VSGSARFLSGYYLLGTVGFWILDALLSAPVRVALGSPTRRLGYYGLLLALGWLCRARPGAAPVVGIIESAINLILIFVGLWLPILSMIDVAAAGGEVGPPLTVFRVVNAALAVGVLSYSLQRNEAALTARARPEGQ
jgi:hypothetical protein